MAQAPSAIAEGALFAQICTFFLFGYCSGHNLGVEWNMQSGRTGQHAGVV